MANSFYSAVKNFEMFDNIIQNQPENPTKRLNLMLRNGVKRTALESFLREGLTQQFAFDGEGWKGVRRHVRFCEKNGWRFSIDFDDFLASSERDLVIKIIGFGKPSVIKSTLKKQLPPGQRLKVGDRHARLAKPSPKKQSPSGQRLKVGGGDARLAKILLAVKKRVQQRVDSLDAVHRFYRTGIEAWLKVEVVAALGNQVVALHNRGPDMTLTDGLQIELKAATDFNPSWYRDGALKDGVPCLFLGNGEDERAMNRLKSLKQIRVIGLHCFSGIHTWAVGCIVPAEGR